MQDVDDLTNLGEVSVQGTRRADVLKLWSLQHIGLRGYAQLIEESYRLTRFFTKEISQRPFLEIVSQPEMNIVCFRGVPDWIAPDFWDQWNTNLQEHLLRSGNNFLLLPLYRGNKYLRAVLLNPYTETDRITKLFECVDSFSSTH